MEQRGANAIGGWEGAEAVRPIARRDRASVARRYGAALVACGAAVLAYYLLEPHVGSGAPLLVMTLPAFGAALYGGLGPGLVATAVSLVTTRYLFMEPLHALTPPSTANELQLLFFGVIGVAASIVCEGRCRAEERQLGALAREREATARLEEALDRERLARTEAERLGRVKDEFISTVSHELRTPLNAILGWAQILLKDSPEAHQAKGLDVIARNARTEAAIVADLLDASRVWSGKLHVAASGTCDLVELVGGTIESMSPAARDRGIEIRAALPRRTVPVECDVERLRQVVRNLIDNAIKFSEPGGRVDVSVSSAEGMARIEVADQGRGIAPEVAARLFQKFEQADASTTRRHGGLGLGLYLAKAIVTAHRGTIEVASAGLGYGARFVVTLPRASTASEEIPAPAGLRSPATLGGRRVLVVDDDRDACDVVRRILADRGARVDTEQSADAALRTWQAGRHAVVVSDLSMPEHDGFWLASQIRAASDGHGPRLVALSALVRDEDRASARAHGFDAFVPKPLETSSLVQAVLG